MKPRQPKNLLGKRWARLEVIAFVGKMPGRSGYYWKCSCKCGGSTELRTTQVVYETTGSCGCLSKEKLLQRMRKHGEGRTALAAVWRAMIARCHNSRNRQYAFYGAKGVQVCKRWRDDFLAFKADVGDRPEGMQLDRWPNPLGNYEPGNVRWATCKVNQRNRRNNILATIDGTTRTAVEWMETYGVNYGTFWKRLKLGWTPEKALTTPVRKSGQPIKESQH